jgi:hypothetical protein
MAYRTAVLLSAEGDPVATVLVPRLDWPPLVLLWGGRVFVRDENGRYHEAASLQVFTPEEYESMMREGIVT